MENKFFPNKVTQSPPLFLNKVDWTAPKIILCHKVFGGSQFTRHELLAAFLCLKSFRRIWCRVNHPFILFIHHIRGKQYYQVLFVYRTDLRKKSAVFHNFTRQIALSRVNIQEARRTRFPCTTNYRIDHIIKRFHEKNSTISGPFSKNNLLLCGTQGNNGLLAKPFEIFSKSPIWPAGSHFWPSAKNQSELSSV